MDNSSDSASCAHITFSAEGRSAAELSFPERHIMLDAAKNSIIIGRASKTSSKGFLAEKDNGWFDSAVMSRKHAEIKADVDTLKVKIRDLGSLHGTYLNDGPDGLSKEFRELRDGDSIRFGVGVWRGSESFVPTTVKVGIAFDHRSERASSTFRVPEDSDNESDIECYSSNGDRTIDDNAPVIIVGTKRISETIDLTESKPSISIAKVSQTTPPKGARANDVIDLSSPPQSPAVIDDDEMSETSSILELREMPGPVFEGSAAPRVIEAEDGMANEGPDMDEVAYLDEISEIHSDDERLSFDCESDEGSENDFTDSDAENESSTSSVVGEPGASYDIEYGIDSEQASDVDDVESDSSCIGRWEEDEADEEDDHDEDVDRCFGELDDTSDEDEPTDPFWNPPFGNRFKVSDHSAESIVAAVKPPPPVTISGLLNSDSSNTGYPPTFRPPLVAKPWESHVLASQTQRPHSPSDVIMSKTFGKSADGLQERTGAELLAQKSGKHDYFAAREMNKISLQKQAGAVSSLHSLCNDTIAAIESLDDQYGILEYTPGPPSAARLPHLSSHFGPLDMLATEATATRISCNPLKEPVLQATSEPAVAAASQEETQDAPVPTAQQSAPPPSEAATGSDVGRRTHLGIADILDNCQKPVDERKGKRKAKDISTLSEDEEQWVKEDNAVPTKVAVPISPTPSLVSEPVPAKEASPAPVEAEKAVTESQKFAEVDNTVETVSEPEGRAPKRQRLLQIAERVGYAALGGVTAGAMIVGTLIYTAPTF
ncbi:hypothetical protein B0T14DRAFT_122057 [Immersiella caudata]|uniref:FHA domain-containing protein n=1 Tax=Immersiella caudata TaxID=314043 RepID=A0AA40C6Z0_9PEZI|nr:hypothetical protein B0T14DRAFT_122057 [Immersiella caudata]